MAHQLQQNVNWRSGTIFTYYAARGRVIHYVDGYVVECKLHLRQMRVGSVHVSDPESKLFDRIDEAFDSCPGCVDEKEWAKSRWPSGAEL